ncbi:MAG: hypothetical protein LBB84_10390 [Tannerellaceae bacterium]|jgi:hypothetical protein|nr:hypothetical protein [Tannerellaceae bacterium]
MQKIVDYPAGHSMDTDWFAVDEKGNVGLFNSCGEGALPIQVERETAWEDFFLKHTIPLEKGLRQLFLNEQTLNRLIDRCTARSTERVMDGWLTDGCIVILNEGYTWEDLDMEKYFVHADDFALQLSPHKPVYLLCSTWQEEWKIEDAIKNKVVAKACPFSLYADDGSDNRITINELGFFVYNHSPNDWATEPYKRVCVAETPLNKSLLNEKDIEEIPLFAEISFEQHPYLQPTDYLSCRTFLDEEDEEEVK